MRTSFEIYVHKDMWFQVSMSFTHKNVRKSRITSDYITIVFVIFVGYNKAITAAQKKHIFNLVRTFWGKDMIFSSN